MYQNDGISQAGKKLATRHLKGSEVDNPIIA
jgi:hypothetical protein